MLDLTGTFAFAIIGAYKALEKRFNIYGIFACAALTALGGGTIREILLRHLPFYFVNHTYLYITLAGSLMAIALYKCNKSLKPYVLLIDAIGLTAFAFIGAEKAAAAGLGLVGILFFAALTASGGGILADIMTNNRPDVFHKDLYILPAIVGGILFFLLGGIHRFLPNTAATTTILLIPFTMRMSWLIWNGKTKLIPPSLQRYFMRQLS